MKRRLLIITHAPSPNTKRLFDAVLEGASESSEIEIAARDPFEAGPGGGLAAGGIILGTTEDPGCMRGAVEGCFDRGGYPRLGATRGGP